MEKTLEKNLSFTLAVLTLLVFVLTILGMFVGNMALGLAWNLLVLITWIFMLIYSLVVFFDKTAYKLSILVGILTGLSFLALASHALIILTRFIGGLSNRLIFPNILLITYSQKIFYTSLILIYFIHVFNYLSLHIKAKKLDKEEETSNKDLDKEDISKEDLEILNSHRASDNPFILDDKGDKNKKEGVDHE
ncbi:MAG: hypothetical protein Q4D88_03765 [Anaerococcus sp.]|nr:hypothetical protein [Anaerococcus sp.]